ncbi:hypothetical protein U9M48_038469, partial [Paspalum notatum var. saurae]
MLDRSRRSSPYIWTGAAAWQYVALPHGESRCPERRRRPAGGCGYCLLAPSPPSGLAIPVTKKYLWIHSISVSCLRDPANLKRSGESCPSLT